MDRIAYKPLPLDAMAGTSRDMYAVPLDGLQSYTSSDTGAPPLMRFRLENTMLIDTEYFYLGAVFTVNYTGGVATNVPDLTNDATGMNSTSKATTGGILCPQAVESIIERIETRAGGQSVDNIPSKYSLLQSFLNSAMPDSRAKNFGGVLGLGNAPDRLIPFSRTDGVPITAGWQGRELLIPLHATMFSNPRSGLWPGKFIRGGSEIYITFAQPSDILGQVRSTDQDGAVVTGSEATGITFTLTSPRLYYRQLQTAADEAWTAKLRAGGSIPYPISRWNVTTNTIPATQTGSWNWNFPVPGADVRCVVFGFQLQGRRGTDNPWNWSDDSTYCWHSSAYSNPNTYGALRNATGDVVGGREPILGGLSSAALYVNDQPFPAYGGGFRFISTTAVPSGASAFLDFQKVCAIVSDDQDFGASCTKYREWIDSDYCSTRKLPTTLNRTVNVGGTRAYTSDPAVGGDYKDESCPHSFWLAFSLSSDPMHDDDRAGLGFASDADSKMVRLELNFTNTNPLPYNAATNPYGGDVVVTAFSLRKSTMLITEDSVSITDKIVVA